MPFLPPNITAVPGPINLTRKSYGKYEPGKMKENFGVDYLKLNRLPIMFNLRLGAT